MPDTPSSSQPLTPSGLLAQVRDGLKYVGANPGLRGLFVLLTMGDFGAAFLWPVHAVFVARVFHRGPEVYGALATASLLGSFVGAMMLGRFSRRFHTHPRQSYVLAALAWGVSALGYGINSSLALAFGLRFLIGIALSVVSIPLAAQVDAQTDDAFRGRVGATMSLGSQVVSPLAVTLSGLIVDTWTPRASYAVAGSILLVTALLSLKSPAFQNSKFDQHLLTTKATK